MKDAGRLCRGERHVYTVRRSVIGEQRHDHAGRPHVTPGRPAHGGAAPDVRSRRAAAGAIADRTRGAADGSSRPATATAYDRRGRPALLKRSEPG